MITLHTGNNDCHFEGKSQSHIAVSIPHITLSSFPVVQTIKSTKFAFIVSLSSSEIYALSVLWYFKLQMRLMQYCMGSYLLPIVFDKVSKAYGG